MYTEDSASYCAQGGLTWCSQAITSVDADPEVTTVFFVYAAFPAAASPRLLGVTFGIDYDAQVFSLVDDGHCADFALPTENWPDAGSGTALTWATSQTRALVELAWFAGYAASDATPTTFDLTEHPTQDADFADDSIPAVLDPLAGLGKLGFGESGVLPCPDSGGGGSPEGPTGYCASPRPYRAPPPRSPSRERHDAQRR